MWQPEEGWYPLRGGAGPSTVGVWRTVLGGRPVVVKRLVIREEVRLRFVATETPFEEAVSVRRQKATIDRTASSPEDNPNQMRKDGP